MTDDRPLVLVLGGSGRTGQSVVQGLIKSGKFRVAAMIRPQSVSKPETEELRSSGVEIRMGDLSDSVDELKKTLEGVNTLISVVSAWVLDTQRDIFRVAKETGVQRVIPCDWATPGAKSVRAVNDTKLAIREYIKDLRVPYTFIDVGWWMQLYLPLPLRSAAPPHVKAMTCTSYGSGDVPILVTDLSHIGTYVARIVADPRTLNQAVMVWEDEVSRNEALEIGERISGDGDELGSKRITIGADELQEAVADGRAKVAKVPTDFDGAHMQLAWSEYMHSMHVLGENTLENAKRLGYLDVRELYPDVPARTLEDYAHEFYGLKEPGDIFARNS